MISLHLLATLALFLLGLVAFGGLMLFVFGPMMGVGRSGPGPYEDGPLDD